MMLINVQNPFEALLATYVTYVVGIIENGSTNYNQSSNGSHVLKNEYKIALRNL
jgi:hypothetical protein